jgi:ATP-dependent DNA helicase RecQ
MKGDKYTVLKACFGYTGFREGQEAVIDALLAGRDALAVMPTGAGKSLCYQIPALLLEGLTVVISPLISLMKDQVNALTEAGVPSVYLNSSLSPAEYGETLRRISRGECRIIYVAPERLLKGELRDFAETLRIPLVVIDEAHCVSQWGHDFRPSYLQIAEFVRSLRERPVTAAFTATATPRVREDIVRALDLRDPYTISTGFDRRNLYFEVRRPRDKTAALLDCLKHRKDKSGIVYCSTRKTVEELWRTLGNSGFAVTRYHAGLDDRERRENQDDFLYDRKTLMVATNAFGMGIDKSNVSFVIHYNMPKNIESYYQEAGRAGRDGERAECILFYSGEDVRINTFLITNGGDEPEKDEALIRHNLELLKYMTFYAAGSDCLRSRILRYFGESAPDYCGNCSNCTTLFESADITLEAQKIISCVYRLKQRGRSFGKTMVADILRGKEDGKISAQGLDTLSTYGIMAGTDPRRIRRIMDYLVEQGYLAVEGETYPVVALTGRSGEIVFEKKPLRMMLPRDSKVSREPAVQKSLPLNEALFERLKELRKRFAGAARVPSYIIFTDASLRDMCRRLPVTPEAFLEVSGVGSVKMEKYGPAFTALIRDHVEKL